MTLTKTGRAWRGLLNDSIVGTPCKDFGGGRICWDSKRASDDFGGDVGTTLAGTATGLGGGLWWATPHDSAIRKLADSGADDSTDDSGGGRRGRARTSLLL